MARIWRCPKCELEVHPGATVCPSCKVEMSQCPWCLDLTTLVIVEPARGLRRARIQCDRCARHSMRCRSGLLGGYCNGLARADGRSAKQLCAACSAGLVNAGKTVAAWTLIGLVTSRLRPRR